MPSLRPHAPPQPKRRAPAPWTARGLTPPCCAPSSPQPSERPTPPDNRPAFASPIPTRLAMPPKRRRQTAALHGASRGATVSTNASRQIPRTPIPSLRTHAPHQPKRRSWRFSTRKFFSFPRSPHPLHPMLETKIPWPHAPLHRLAVQGTYFVTVGTYRKRHRFRGNQRLSVLHRGLLKTAWEFHWQLEAWAVFSNHYHFVAHSPQDTDSAQSLSQMLSKLHTKTSDWINRIDKTPGGKNWHNFRDTRLTYQRSYLARLNYVHQNPVKHGLVRVASHYPWCSAAWFERTAPAGMVNSIYRFDVNKVSVPDEFTPSDDW